MPGTPHCWHSCWPALFICKTSKSFLIQANWFTGIHLKTGEATYGISLGYTENLLSTPEHQVLKPGAPKTEHRQKGRTPGAVAWRAGPAPHQVFRTPALSALASESPSSSPCLPFTCFLLVTEDHPPPWPLTLPTYTPGLEDFEMITDNLFGSLVVSLPD